MGLISFGGQYRRQLNDVSHIDVSLPPPSLVLSKINQKHIFGWGIFFFKWEFKKRKEKNLAVKTPLCLPILFCEVYCLVYNWSEVWFWTLPIWILLKIQVVSLIGKDTGTDVRCLFSIGPLGLPQVWNGSICVGMRGAPLQSLSACVCGWTGASQAVLLGAVS